MATSFNPPHRTLMGPGPSDMHPRVLQAMSRPVIGHLDPRFVEMMDEVKEMLQGAFQTRNELTMAVSAPGSAGMETCLVNLLEPGDTAVICSNGVFGGRMKAITERCGAKAVEVVDDWGQPVDPQKVEDALKAHSEASLVAFVHAETSTGALSDAAAIAGIAKRHGCLTVVDAVTSLAGSPLETDAWGLDAVYSGSQKCLSCTPGLSPITLSPAAVERIAKRRTPVQSWFLDLGLVMGYWGGGQKRSYHHTAPVNALYALHESLVMLEEEGLHASHQRHRKNHEDLRDGLAAMGIRYVVEPEHRLPQLNAVWIPEGVDDAAVRKELLERYNLEIGGGLGALAGRVWRIGLMGAASTPRNVALCLGALGDVLSRR
jgi:alanine-glyoxylate transaminase / serine-glyoxylate transaminase / serine-pyruvate transaminase